MSTFFVSHGWRSATRQWPLTVISLGILFAFVWVAVLVWLLVCALDPIT